VSAHLERGVTVQVVAATLANGAPHPHHGRTGVVLDVAAGGQHPVRVQVAGRAVRFAADELEHVVVRPGDTQAWNSVSPDGTRQIDTPGTY
jgi:ribosomal protein L21E